MKGLKRGFICSLVVALVMLVLALVLRGDHLSFLPRSYQESTNYDFLQGIFLGLFGGALLSAVMVLLEYKSRKKDAIDVFLIEATELAAKFDSAPLFHSFLPDYLIRCIFMAEAIHSDQQLRGFLKKWLDDPKFKDDILSYAVNAVMPKEKIMESLPDDPDFFELCKDIQENWETDKFLQHITEETSRYLESSMRFYIDLSHSDLSPLIQATLEIRGVWDKKLHKLVAEVFNEINDVLLSIDSAVEDFNAYFQYGTHSKLQMLDHLTKINKTWFKWEPEYSKEFVKYKIYRDISRNIVKNINAVSQRVDRDDFLKDSERRLYFYPQYFGPLHNANNPEYEKK